ncbi:Hypothetical predicted protein [Mytilus galloprovincialis]|uniref:Protein quiver n=1 Tax=Mytilus galloprovincialis TaxID=29158 RepID=A0A8B6DY38_MYTGA|nr:Hypothetical predicted protein [Mytilus galloprovincialis]
MLHITMDVLSVLCIYCFLFLTTVVEVENIRCYECTSQFTSSCGKDFKLKSSDTNYITDDQCNRCLKRITIQPNIKVYSRECSKATVDNCNTISAQEEQCFCDTDLCNKSSTMTVTVTTLIINIMLFYILK